MRKDEFVKEVKNFCSLVVTLNSGESVNIGQHVTTNYKRYMKKDGIMFDIVMPSPALNLAVTTELKKLNMCNEPGKDGCAFYMEAHLMRRFAKALNTRKMHLISQNIAADIAEENDRDTEDSIRRERADTLEVRIDEITSQFDRFMTKLEISGLRNSLALAFRSNDVAGGINRMAAMPQNSLK